MEEARLAGGGARFDVLTAGGRKPACKRCVIRHDGGSGYGENHGKTYEESKHGRPPNYTFDPEDVSGSYMDRAPIQQGAVFLDFHTRPTARGQPRRCRRSLRTRLARLKQ
jgi:hypothetical protein